jgi:flavin reductase (DIM6/NTAB) family NADH-FMN oxidoreductase RutF
MTSERAAEGSSPVDPRAFRRVVGHFATGVTVCTTLVEGQQRAMTANSFTSVSLDPPLVLICVEKIARFHDDVLAAGIFGVSVLNAGQEPVSRHFAIRGGEDDPTRFVGLPQEVGRLTGCVLLTEAIATLECRVWSTCDGGDHTVVVGEVLGLGEKHDAGEPLLYHQGTYRTF